MMWFAVGMVTPWEYNKSTWFVLSILTGISMTSRAAASEGEEAKRQSPPVGVVLPYGGSRLRPT